MDWGESADVSHFNAKDRNGKWGDGSPGGALKLISVDRNIEDAAKVLWELLAERNETINIDCNKMPTWQEHWAYVHVAVVNHYKQWYLIEVDRKPVGSIYLTNKNNIGIFIFKAHQGKGYGPAAITMLMAQHPGIEFGARINPKNVRSIKMFERLGFGHAQSMYRRIDAGSSRVGEAAGDPGTV